MNKIIILFIALAVFFLPVSGDDPVNIENIIAGELNHLLITSVIQDTSGFIWIGTENGLFRYDGNELLTFQHDFGDENSLSHNYISKIIEDGEGSLWVGTAGGGVCRLDMKSGECSRYELDRREKSHRNFVTDLLITEDGSVFASTLDGLFEWESGAGEFKLISEKYRDKQFFIRRLEQMDRDTVVVGTPAGVDFYNIIEKEFLREGVFKTNHISVYSMSKWRDGKFLFGTDKTLLVYLPAEDKLVPYEKYTGIRFPFSNALVYFIYENRNGLFLATDKGFFQITDSGRVRSFLSGERITVLHSDRSGVLWIGTYFNGLKKYSLFRNKFSQEDSVTAFLQKEKVNVTSMEESTAFYWLGTIGQGLFRVEKKPGSSKKIEIFKNLKKGTWGDKHIRTMFMDREKNLWVGTSRGLRVLSDPDSFLLTGGEPEVTTLDFKLSSQNINVVFRDSRGFLWVGTQRGLNCIDIGTGIGKDFNSLSKGLSALNKEWITTMKEDRPGNIWIGTLDGLYRYSPSSGNLKKYAADVRNPGSLSFNDITDMMIDHNGGVWISTWSGGLNFYRNQKDIFETFSTRDGLVSNTIMSILEGKNGRVWIATTNGISEFNFKNRVFTNYNSSDGLNITNFYYRSKFRADSGKIYFFGYKGVEIIDEDNVPRNSYIPGILITSVRFLGKDILRNRLDDADKKKYVFSHREKNFQIGFTSLDYNIPEKNRFAYRIDPIDDEDEWHPIGNVNRITFYSLPDGINRIFVKGTNSDGLWNEEATWVDIEITPPFWRTTWFRIFMGLLIVIIIYILFQLRLKMMIRKMEKDARVDYFCRKNKISSREKDVLVLLLEGKSNKEIEDILFISSNTVRNHVYNIYQKLGIQKRVQLMKLFETSHGDTGEEKS